MKQIEIKPEYIGKTFQIEAPFIGHINMKVDTIEPDSYEYFINAGYGYLFDITEHIDKPEPMKTIVISYKGVEPTPQDKPKKKGRPKKTK